MRTPVLADFASNPDMQVRFVIEPIHKGDKGLRLSINYRSDPKRWAPSALRAVRAAADELLKDLEDGKLGVVDANGVRMLSRTVQLDLPQPTKG